LLLIQYDKIKE
jgi:sphinganine-1-phosphate aldolase